MFASLPFSRASSKLGETSELRRLKAEDLRVVHGPHLEQFQHSTACLQGVGGTWQHVRSLGEEIRHFWLFVYLHCAHLESFFFGGCMIWVSLEE